METYSSDMQLTEHHIFGMSDNLPSIKVHVTKGSISSCEHYSRRYDVDHFIYFDITKGLYETRYLEALFLGDTEVISEYEEDAAFRYDMGPLAFCSSVSNFSAIKVNCCK